jgi:alkyl hydroperoxide reductase subunit AhpF
MPLLSPQDREKVRGLLGDLEAPVRLVLFTVPTSPLIVPGQPPACETCDDAQHLLEEVADLSEQITLEVHNFQRERELADRYGVERVPSLLVLGPEEGRVRYAGAPFGHEFALLLQDIRLVSTGETRLAPATREALAAMPDPINIRVFVTPT